MKNTLKYLFSFLILGSCTKDFIAPDLSKNVVKITAPINNLRTTSNSMNFSWDNIDGADSYQLQIGQPKFDSLTKILFDTVVTKNKFTCILAPGVYQWRVRAANSASESDYSTANFIIDSTSDLSSVLVILKTPISGYVQNFSATNFSWDKVFKAKKYHLQINKGVILDTIVETTGFTYKIPSPINQVITYSWNVKAINDISEGNYNVTPFNLIIDRKSPNTPGLIKPVNTATVTSIDSLKWQRAADVALDTLFISEDSTFSNKYSYRVEQSYTVLNDLQLSPNTTGNFYYWKVISFDAVGNPSQFSVRRKFKLNP